MLIDSSTIVACATPPGHGGVAIVRLSGVDAKQIAGRISRSKQLDYQACYGAFVDVKGDQIDVGLSIYFKAPHSFTGEDVVELHSHGSPAVVDQLIKTSVSHGARMAQPGEFSQRAFLNGKMDLVQAEAVADLIASGSDLAARSALRSLKGEFSKQIEVLAQQILDLRIYVEAAIDFPDEEIDFLEGGLVGMRLKDLLDALSVLLKQADQGVLIQEGLSLAIIGPPNVGKSSLLNALAQQDRAIVTEIPGTTRDILSEHITLQGVPINLSDTAGLRETQDVVEQQGILRAQEQALQSDVVLLMLDASCHAEDDRAQFLKQFELMDLSDRCITVFNKIDLMPEINLNKNTLKMSIKNKQGLDALVQCLLEKAGYQGAGVGTFSARRRHILALNQSLDLVRAAYHAFQAKRAGECLAEDLRLAHQALGEITGTMHSDELLGHIFSSFCIGK